MASPWLPTLAAPIGGDRVVFELDPAKFEDQSRRLDVLGGDVDRDGTVLADDFSDVRRSFFTSTTRPGIGTDAYSIFADVNGSGSILADDYSAVKRRFFTKLPDGGPAADAVAAAAVGGPRLRPRPMTRMLFGAVPVPG